MVSPFTCANPLGRYRKTIATKPIIAGEAKISYERHVVSQTYHFILHSNGI